MSEKILKISFDHILDMSQPILTQAVTTAEQLLTPDTKLVSGLDGVKVECNPDWIRSVKTVYDKDSLMKPSLTETGKYYILSQTRELTLKPNDKIQINTDMAITEIRLRDIPLANYTLVINGSPCGSSKNNTFKISEIKNQTLDDFLRKSEEDPTEPCMCDNEPLPFYHAPELCLYQTNILDICIAKPKAIQWPDKCLVEITGYKFTESIKPTDTQELSTECTICTPIHMVQSTNETSYSIYNLYSITKSSYYYIVST